MPGPGDLVGRFRLEALIGRGGMGVVYRAAQPGLERDVALKVISPEWSSDPVFRARFREEARLAAAVEHPNVLPVHDAGEANGVLYLAMRLVQGPDLGVLVRHAGPLAPARAAGIVGQVAAALGAAHAVGLVHRDVKPSNVLVSETGAGEHVYLTDFGLARLAAGGATLTADGRWAGTADYAAPEQIRGERGDARTDVYAAGAVLFWTLTGSVPFPRDTQEAKLWAHLHAPPSVPSALAPGVPPALDAVVARALAKAPEDRYPSAAAFGRALAEALPGPDADAGVTREAATLPAVPTPRRGAVRARFARRAAGGRPGRLVLGMAAVAALVVAAAVAALAASGDGNDRRAGAHGSALARAYDFDGDGRQEPVAGLPARAGGGAVAVVGDGRGGDVPPTLLRPGAGGVPAAASPRARFGAALASSDFDGDGFADLAVGAPGDAGAAGAVTIVFGGRGGLSRERALRFTGASSGGRFGAALVAGDVDGDGFGDLVVGAPGDDRRADEDGSGAVRLLFGAPGEELGDRDRPLARPRAADAGFGSELALADVDGDRHPDLAEAARGAGPLPGHGSYCAGGADGPRACAPLGPVGATGPAALAMGDVNGDGRAEVLQGVPDHANGPAGPDEPAGAVVVWPGSRRGPEAQPLVLTQAGAGVRGGEQRGDAFGAALAVADLDGDGYGDVVVGVPGEDDAAGRVVVVRGAPRGAPVRQGVLVQEGRGEIPGTRRAGERFGAEVSLLEVDGDGRLDLAVTDPGDGTVLVLPGTAKGFSGARARTLRLPAPEPAVRSAVLGRRGAS